MSVKYTSVKLRVRAKEKLEELQARLRLRGVRASLHEILEKLIDLGIEEEEELVRRIRGKQSSKDRMLELLDKPLDWGVEDASEKIDEVLYGAGNVGVHRHKHIRSS